MTPTLRSFRSFNYRLWFTGAFVSNIGVWMQNTALGWAVLTEFTDTNAVAMGTAMALQFAPALLLVGPAGSVADHFDRRKTMIIIQALMITLALSLSVLLATGRANLTLMYGYALAIGLVTAFDNPVRQTLIANVVRREDTPNAVALNAASFNAARMIGPAIAGFLILTVGTPLVFLLNALASLCMVLALACMRKSEIHIPVRSDKRGKQFAGLQYITRRADFVVALSIVFLMGFFGLNFTIFASNMAIQFGRSADGFGLLSSMIAVGALIGALLSARRMKARLHVIVHSALVMASSAAAASVMPTFWTHAVTLTFVGIAMVTTFTTTNGYIQMSTRQELTGRVLAIYTAVLSGSTALGAPVVGWLTDGFGPRTAMLIAASVALLGWFLSNWYITKKWPRTKRGGNRVR